MTHIYRMSYIITKLSKIATILLSLCITLHGRFQIDTARMCMVGDRLDTDILFGKNAGCKTLLVLSGPIIYSV